MNKMPTIEPWHVFTFLITVVMSALVAMVGFLWRISKAITAMDIKMDLMWSDFSKRKELNGKGSL